VDRAYTLLFPLGKVDVERYLIGHVDVAINEAAGYGRSPLHCACIRGQGTEIVKALLQHQEIDINIKDKFYKTPIQYHFECNGQQHRNLRNQIQIAQLLLYYPGVSCNLESLECVEMLHKMG
jgi:ankyrin repeat protein